MKNRNRRRKGVRSILSILVSLLMILTMLPNQLVSAADDERIGQEETALTDQQTVDNEETDNAAE